MTVAERWEIGEEEERKYAGKWVAIKDGRVVYSADDPADVVSWVKSRRIDADLLIHLPPENAPKVWVL